MPQPESNWLQDLSPALRGIYSKIGNAHYILGNSFHARGVDMGMEESCECCCEEKKEPKFGDMMVGVADKAWMRVVQGKLEAIIEKKNGKELDRVAKLTYDYAHALYGAKMAGRELPKGAAEKFEKELMAALKG